MFKLDKEKEITLEVIKEFSDRHKTLVDKKYKPLYDAYTTHYDIFRMPPKPKHKPDNRLAVNFASYITDTMVGFFSGIAPKIASADEDVNNYLDMINAYNVYDDLNAEEAKYAAIYGHDYEILYNDEKGEIGFARSSPMFSFAIYDDSILERKRAFVRLYRDTDDRVTGSVSDESIVRYFELRPELKWLDGEKPHGFNGVPFTEFKINAERQGLFEPVMSLIDAYNKALSEKANDVDYFADAYLKVLGALLEEEEIKHIRDDRVINFDGVDSEKLVVDFLNKPDGDGTQEHLLDRLESLIFKMAKVADISDEQFAGSSGIALKYKTLAMSNMARVMERKFKGAMQERYRLAFSNPVSPIREEDFIKIDYHFTLNYPANLAEEAQIATQLDGVTSKETQLKVLSIIDNPKEEISRIEEENSVVNPLDMRYGK